MMGDASSHERLRIAADETDGALKCLPLMILESKARRRCAFGADALVAETFLMLDCASRKASLSSSLAATGQEADPVCDVLRDLVRRAMSMRPAGPAEGRAIA
jgi:hypothetical protein